MILHLSAAGVPIAWTITALYRDSYGIALNAARSWFAHTHCLNRQAQPDSPQFVVEIEERPAGWAIKRSDLMMDPYHLRHQHCKTLFIQDFTAPLPLPAGASDAVLRALTAELTSFGFLIPRSEWEERYPGQKLIADHFATFNVAYDAHKATGAKGLMPFELRWSPYMSRPEGFVFPYGVAAREDGWIVTFEGAPSDDDRIHTEDDANARKRLLNSGYDFDQVDILMQGDPIDDGHD